ncbi:hypothetical protein P9112_001854 [Eukaryota sp. TZLM1-RC]
MIKLIVVLAVFVSLSIAAPDRQKVESLVQTFFDANNDNDCERLVSIFENQIWVEDPKGADVVRTKTELFNLCKQGRPFVANKLSPQMSRLHISHDGAAIPWTFFGAFDNGCVVEFDGIDVFEISVNYKVLKMIGYFDSQDVANQVARCLE